ncbi:MAG: hypothetical protein WBN03_08175, partial [Desulfobacterales bacterium]
IDGSDSQPLFPTAHPGSGASFLFTVVVLWAMGVWDKKKMQAIAIRPASVILSAVSSAIQYLPVVEFARKRQIHSS